MTLKAILLSTTVSSQKEAETLATFLLENKLVACVQITPIQSLYKWKGKINKEEEFLLTLKTFDSLYPHIENLLHTHHPYDVPEIIATPIIHISQTYLAWMEDTILDATP